ncbi:MAG: Panacea domain-containing protein [Candidatus Zixiibacteriota bacterium]
MVKFKFDANKFKSLMRLLCARVKDIDRLKAVKLLYFIDKQSLISTGRPVLGDVYIRMDLGPVPSNALDLLEEFPIGDNGESEFFYDEKTSVRYPSIISRIEPNLDIFSEAELDCIGQVIESLGKLSSKELSVLSHNDCTWKESKKNSPIDYKLFFKDNPVKNRFAFEAMLSEQEDQEFLKNF